MLKAVNKPNPGSKEAVVIGCLCPVFDNAHGEGSGYKKDNGKPAFWISERCPVHDVWDGDL